MRLAFAVDATLEIVEVGGQAASGGRLRRSGRPAGRRRETGGPFDPIVGTRIFIEIDEDLSPRARQARSFAGGSTGSAAGESSSRPTISMISIVVFG